MHTYTIIWPTLGRRDQIFSRKKLEYSLNLTSAMGLLCRHQSNRTHPSEVVSKSSQRMSHALTHTANNIGVKIKEEILKFVERNKITRKSRIAAETNLAVSEYGHESNQVVWHFLATNNVCCAAILFVQCKFRFTDALQQFFLSNYVMKRTESTAQQSVFKVRIGRKETSLTCFSPRFPFNVELFAKMHWLHSS